IADLGCANSISGVLEKHNLRAVIFTRVCSPDWHGECLTRPRSTVASNLATYSKEREDRVLNIRRGGSVLKKPKVAPTDNHLTNGLRTSDFRTAIIGVTDLGALQQ